MQILTADSCCKESSLRWENQENCSPSFHTLFTSGTQSLQPRWPEILVVQVYVWGHCPIVPACLYLLIWKAWLWFGASLAKLGVLKTNNLVFTAVTTTGEREIAKTYFLYRTDHCIVISSSVSSLEPCSLIFACTAIDKKKNQIFRNPKLSQLLKIITQLNPNLFSLFLAQKSSSLAWGQEGISKHNSFQNLVLLKIRDMLQLSVNLSTPTQ